MGIVKQFLQALSYYSIDLYRFYIREYIEYCSTYFGTHHATLKSMFVNRTYSQLDDGLFDDENYNQDWVDEVNIVDIRGLTTMNEMVIVTMLMCPKVCLPPWIET
jgi:hypothetical protein